MIDAVDVIDAMIRREATTQSQLLDRTPMGAQDQVVRRAAGIGAGIRLEALIDAKDEIVRERLHQHERESNVRR